MERMASWVRPPALRIIAHFGKVEAEELLRDDARIATGDCMFVRLENQGGCFIEREVTDGCCCLAHLLGLHDALLQERRRFVCFGIFPEWNIRIGRCLGSHENSQVFGQQVSDSVG